MKRRKYLISTLSMGTALSLFSVYGIKPTMSSEIIFNDGDSIILPKDVTDTVNFNVQLEFETFKLQPHHIGSEVKLEDINVRLKTNSTSYSEYKSIYDENDTILENNTTTTIDIHNTSLDVEFNEDSDILMLEFIVKTEDDDYTIEKEISISDELMLNKYAINDENGVFIYDEDGELLHSTSMSRGGGSSAEGAIVDRESEFAITNDYRGIYCSRFNIETGEEEWNVEIDTSNSYGIAFDVNTRDFYLGERSAGLGKYNKEDGSRIWRVSSSEFDERVDAITADADGNVYAADRNAYVYKISPDGDMIWDTQTDDSRLRGAIQSDPYGNLYSWGTSNFYKHDSEGELIYKTSNINKNTRRNAFAVDRFGNIIACTGNEIRKLENDAETQLWRESIDSIANGLGVDWDGNIFAVDDDGRFYGFEPDGTLKFKRRDGTHFGDFNYSNTLGGSMSNENLLYYIEENDAIEDFENYE